MKLIFKGLFLLFKAQLKAQRKGAKFLEAKHLRKIVNSSHKGLLLNGKKLSIDQENSFKHCLVVAPTGAGKTTSYIIPNILHLANYNNSIIVTDPAGEIYNKTSQHLNNKGFNCLVLNPLNLEQSIRYNPLDFANTTREIDQLASVIVNSQNYSNSDPIWNNGAIEIISILIRILKKAPKQYQNLFNVLYLLNNFGSDGKALFELVSKLTIDDELLFSNFKGFISSNEKMVQSYISIAKNSLNKLNDENIAKLLNTNSFDFNQLRKQKTIIYLIIPSAELKDYSFLLDMFYYQFFKYSMQTLPTKQDLAIYCLYDEFGHSSIPNFSTIITTIRKYKVSISIILQSLSQLKSRYKDYNNDILGGINTYIYFSGLDEITAQAVSQKIGTERIKQKQDNQEHYREQTLITANEIRTMPDNEVLVLIANNQPLKLTITPYYKNARFKYYTNNKPLAIENQGIKDKLEFIRLD